MPFGRFGHRALVISAAVRTVVNKLKSVLNGKKREEKKKKGDKGTYFGL